MPAVSHHLPRASLTIVVDDERTVFCEETQHGTTSGTTVEPNHYGIGAWVSLGFHEPGRLREWAGLDAYIDVCEEMRLMIYFLLLF